MVSLQKNTIALALIGFFYWILPIAASQSGIVEGNIDRAVSEIIENVRATDVGRIGVEMSPLHRDYIYFSDRKRIIALIERHLSQKAEGKFEVISRSSFQKVAEEVRGDSDFADFVKQQKVNTVVRINTYDVVGGLDFDLQVAPYGSTSIIAASEQYLLIDSVQALNRFPPIRAMQMVSKQLASYLFEQADLSYSTPFSIKWTAQDEEQKNPLNGFLRDLVVADINKLWDDRYNMSGLMALDDSLPGKVDRGPWLVDVETRIYGDSISANVQLVRDGYVQTNRLIEIDRQEVDPALLPSETTLSANIDQPQAPIDPEQLEGVTFIARGRAVIGSQLVKEEALTAAKLLARAKAISAALGLAPPKIGSVDRTSQIPALVSYLNKGLPYGEKWNVTERNGLIDVQTRLKVIPNPPSAIMANLDTIVLRAMRPLQMKVTSPQPYYFALFAWQCDGTVVRILPFEKGHNLRLDDRRSMVLPTLMLPAGQPMTSVPLDDAVSNHEALVLVTSKRPLNVNDLALRIAHQNEDYLKRGHNDSLFFDKLVLKIMEPDPSASIKFLPYQVVR